MADPTAPLEKVSGRAAARAFGGSDLPARALAGVALMGLALSSAWAGGLWFVLFWLAAALLVFWEWEGLTGASNRLGFAIGAAALVAAAFLAGAQMARESLLALALGAAGAGLTARGAGRSPLWSAAGVLYAGGMLASVCLLRASSTLGLRAILWLFAIVWGTDIMAYFGGRLIGGPKLWARVSPGKTWAGFVVGIVCGAAAGLLAAPASGGAAEIFALGLAGGAVAQGGDLAESAIKRRFGVKDSGRLIPGHGGFMDRLDGFIAAALLAALVGFARGGAGQIATGVMQW
jgi:phosphatidate cytidylyltransferase